MGAWGAGIFENDLAADVRDDWLEAVAEGADPAAAARRIVAEYEADDEPSRTELWTALAAVQLETGTLQPDVRRHALEVIEAGGDLVVWEGDRERSDALDELAGRLRDPSRQPRSAPRPPPAGADPGVEAGDVLRIRSADGARAALFHVAAVTAEGADRWPILLGLHWPPADPAAPPPPREELERLPCLSGVGGSAYAVAVMVQGPEDRFDERFGEIVARGVRRGDEVPEVSSYLGWETVVDQVAEIDALLEATRRRLEG